MICVCSKLLCCLAPASPIASYMQTQILAREEFSFRLLLLYYFAFSASLKEPTSLADVIRLLQKECGLKIPTSEEEWGEIPRTPIDIRRTMVVKDGLREARKSRFDSTKLLNVSTFYIHVCLAYV